MVIRLLLVLTLLGGAFGHRDAAFAHVTDVAASAHHDVEADHDLSLADDVGHVSHHHCPQALNTTGAGLAVGWRSATAAPGLPADARMPPSRAIPPLPEPPTA